VSYRSNDYDVVRGFVRCGLGVALVPALGHVADSGVVPCRLAGMPVYRHVEVLARPAIGNPAVEGVVAALVAVAGAFRDSERGVLHETAEPLTTAGPVRADPTSGDSHRADQASCLDMDAPRGPDQQLAPGDAVPRGDPAGVPGAVAVRGGAWSCEKQRS
jgi:hypothetical protein